MRAYHFSLSIETITPTWRKYAVRPLCTGVPCALLIDTFSLAHYSEIALYIYL